MEPVWVSAGRRGHPMPSPPCARVAEDHAVVKEGVCEDFIAKSQSVEIAHIVLVLLSENARAFLQVGRRTRGLPYCGPFASVGRALRGPSWATREGIIFLFKD